MKAMEIEHDPRLARILTTRGILFSIQGATMALFAFYILIVNGFALAPFFVPLYNVIFLGTMMLLIVSAERIFFFRLCVVYGKRNAAKFLIARKRYRGSIALIAIAALISFILVVFTFTPLMNVSGNSSGQIGTIEFQTNDVFAINTVNSVTLKNLGQNSLIFVIVPASDYNAAASGSQGANESALMQVSITAGVDHVAPGGTTTADIYPSINSQYYIVIFPSVGSVSVSYILGMKSMPSLFYAMLMSFASLPVSGYLAGYSRVKMKEMRTGTIFA